MATAAPTRTNKQIYFATIHHSAVTNGAKNLAELKVNAAKYDLWHSQKSFAIYTDGKYGYKYISYHYMIASNGDVLQTQDIKYVRYHAGDNDRGVNSHNLHGIAICFDGYYHPPHNEKPTEAQLRAAGALIRELEKTTLILTVRGHRDTSLTGTSCAGDLLQAKIPTIIKYANNPPVDPPPTPTCEEQLKTEKANHAKTVLQLEAANKSFGDEVTAHKATKKLLVEAEQTIADKDEELQDLTNQLIDKNEELKGATGRILKLEEDIKTRDEMIISLEDQVKDYKEDLEICQAELKECEESLPPGCMPFGSVVERFKKPED